MNREARILKARRKELGLSQTDQWERDPGCNQISIHALRVGSDCFFP